MRLVEKRETSFVSLTLLSRLAMTTVVVGWVALTATLCGCGTASGVVMNTSGQGYYARGDYSAAAANFSRATLDDPSNPTYAYNLAKALHKQGQTTQAEHQYRRALAIDPRHQPAYNGLASLMEETGRPTEATALLQSWVATQPHLPAAHIEMAALQQRQGDMVGAETSLRQALATDPGNTVALSHMGQVMQQSGRAPEAVNYYRQSLAKNPFQSEVSHRVTAMTRPTPQVVAEASQAPAPQMIAGRANPSFVPQMAAYRPRVPFAAPPFTTRQGAMTPWVPNGISQQQMVAGGSVWSTGSVPPTVGGPIRPAAYSQQSVVQTGPNGQQTFTTPGMGMVAGGPTVQHHVTYQVPTPAVSSSQTLASTVPMSTGAQAVPTLAAPELPEAELGTPESLTPAAFTGAAINGEIEQLNYEVEPEVPSF